MGAGARMAEERDRWADHWQVTDLDPEAEHLLDLLAPAEELRAAVPGRRTSMEFGGGPVLIGVTDRRVLVVGRWRAADPSWQVSVDDATRPMAELAEGGSRVLAGIPGGTIELDLDDSALERLWSHMAGLGGG